MKPKPNLSVPVFLLKAIPSNSTKITYNQQNGCRSASKIENQKYYFSYFHRITPQWICNPGKLLKAQISRLQYNNLCLPANDQQILPRGRYTYRYYFFHFSLPRTRFHICKSSQYQCSQPSTRKWICDTQSEPAPGARRIRSRLWKKCRPNPERNSV